MARDDNTPGQIPFTRGLQVFLLTEQTWVNANSGQAFFTTDDVYLPCRLDPKLFPDGGSMRAVQIQLKSAALLTYSAGNETGTAGDPPTADNGGEATLEVQTFYQPVWLGRGIFQLKTATAATIVEYMIVVRKATKEEQESGE